MPHITDTDHLSTPIEPTLANISYRATDYAMACREKEIREYGFTEPDPVQLERDYRVAVLHMLIDHEGLDDLFFECIDGLKPWSAWTQPEGTVTAPTPAMYK